ncbi:hypothetical protein [Duganella vulcania]|uniref:DUF4412 domain-containing protein n=1 Tax=Duganella vulcania TaxID=2692166 RepID=A0A845H105_9BURK|nr:hypothetical protein [Duganella vulcania]MYM98389.1 hypothetical protein [Duganella vulcania]
MNKKLIGSAGALAAVAVVVLAANRRHAEAPVAPTPRVVAEAPVGLKAPPVTTPAAEEPPADGMEVTQTLKGKDFQLEVTAPPIETVRYLSITMENGQAIDKVQSLHGSEASPISDNTFAPGHTFSLRSLIPGDVREQIVCKGTQMLSRGEGMLGHYMMYRIEGDTLRELIQVIVERDREDGNGPPPQKLKATVEETMRDGQPAIIYRVKVEKQPERTIIFHWNGKIFEDPTGEYAKIESEYNP